MPKGTPRDKQAPSVTITSPGMNATFVSGQGNITITATATDNKAVGRVDFYFREIHQTTYTIIASDTTVSYAATWAIPTVSVITTYAIRAKAVDTSGNFAVHEIYISVSPTPPPSTTTTTTTMFPTGPVPSSFILDTPPVIYQGIEGSCGSCATYVTLSTAKYYKLGSTSYSSNTNLYSIEYLYNQAKVGSDCGSGSSCFYNLEIARSQGVCFASTLPYDYNNGCDPAIITQPMRDQAATQKIASHFTVYTSDVLGMKRALYYGKTALCLGLGNDASSLVSRCDWVWTQLDGSYYTNHIQAIVGYDDSKQAWLVQNSYGTGVGCNGSVWISYDLLTAVGSYGANGAIYA